VQLEIIRIEFDDISQKYSKYSRIKFACVSFHLGLLFYQLLSCNHLNLVGAGYLYSLTYLLTYLLTNRIVFGILCIRVVKKIPRRFKLSCKLNGKECYFSLVVKLTCAF